MASKSLTYYAYVSRTKVEMLFSQIPRKFLDGVTSELKVNLGVASSTLTQKPADDTLLSKLKAVIAYLDENEAMGTIDSPGNFFRGSASVRWGPYGSSGSLVVFSGATDRTIFLLGGSTEHVIGVKPKADVPYVSTTPFLVDALCSELNVVALHQKEVENMSALVSQGRTKESMTLLAIEHTDRWMQGPSQVVDFVAKRLLFEPNGASNRKNLLLASPLYVAITQ